MEIYQCPHCGGSIVILKKNCGIFRHGQYKNGKQVEPHLSKEKCDRLIKDDLIFGCGKPFKLSQDKLEQCDYI